MINTIFYFAPDSFDEQAYRNGLDSENGVSSRTIVFSPSQKAIYKGGVRYGSMSIEDMKEYITQILQQDPTIINNGSDYDDSAIRALINAERDRINQLLANMDQSIINKMNQLFSDKDWLDTNVIDKIQSESNFGEEEVDEYLQRIGLYTVSGNNRTWAWSSIAQDVDSIELEVNQIKSNQQIGGQVDYELLASNVYTYINDNAASSGLQSTWGKFLQLSNGDLARLKWVSTGIANEASSEQGVVDLFAAALEYAEDGQTKLSQAYAGLNALVEQDGHGNWVAKNSLSSMIDDEIALIDTIVRKDANNNIESSVIISADNIDIDGLINSLRASAIKFGAAGSFGFTFAPGNLGGGTGTALFGGQFDSSGNLNSNNIKFELRFDDTNAYQGPCIELTGNGKTSSLRGDGGLLYATIINGEIYNNDMTSNVVFGNSANDICREATHGNTTTEIWRLNTDTSNVGYLSPKLILDKVSMSTWNTEQEIKLDTFDGSVSATGGFKIPGSSDSYVLLAGGGTAALSSLGGGSSSWNGGSITGDITLNSGAKIVDSNSNLSIDSSDGSISAGSVYLGGGTISFGNRSAGLGSEMTFDELAAGDSHSDTVNINFQNGDATFDGLVISGNGTSQGSDITKKDIIADTTLTVDQIADAPSIQFTWKKDTNKTPHVGTSAQYWQTVMPEVITEKNDTVFMDYSSAALVSAITIAKEVVSLKEEIAQLKQQIAELKGNNNE